MSTTTQPNASQFIQFNQITYNIKNPPNQKWMLGLDTSDNNLYIYKGGKAFNIKSDIVDVLVYNGKLRTNLIPASLASKVWVTDQITSKVKSVFILKGVKTTYKEILEISNPEPGDVYLCRLTQSEYVYTSQYKWQELGGVTSIDAAQLQNIYNQINELGTTLRQLISVETERAQTVQNQLSGLIKSNKISLDKSINTLAGIVATHGQRLDNLSGQIDTTKVQLMARINVLSTLIDINKGNINIISSLIGTSNMQNYKNLSGLIATNTNNIAVISAALKNNSLQNFNQITGLIATNTSDILELSSNLNITNQKLQTISGIVQNISSNQINLSSYISSNFNVLSSTISNNYNVYLTGFTYIDSRLNTINSNLEMLSTSVNNKTIYLTNQIDLLSGNLTDNINSLKVNFNKNLNDLSSIVSSICELSSQYNSSINTLSTGLYALNQSLNQLSGKYNTSTIKFENNIQNLSGIIDDLSSRVEYLTLSGAALHPSSFIELSGKLQEALSAIGHGPSGQYTLLNEKINAISTAVSGLCDGDILAYDGALQIGSQKIEGIVNQIKTNL